jgi:hypothetical protein
MGSSALLIGGAAVDRLLYNDVALARALEFRSARLGKPIVSSASDVLVFLSLTADSTVASAAETGIETMPDSSIHAIAYRHDLQRQFWSTLPPESGAQQRITKDSSDSSFHLQKYPSNASGIVGN